METNEKMPQDRMVPPQWRVLCECADEACHWKWISLHADREVKWSIAPELNVGHTHEVIRGWLRLCGRGRRLVHIIKYPLSLLLLLSFCAWAGAHQPTITVSQPIVCVSKQSGGQWVNKQVKSFGPTRSCAERLCPPAYIIYPSRPAAFEPPAEVKSSLSGAACSLLELQQSRDYTR